VNDQAKLKPQVECIMLKQKTQKQVDTGYGEVREDVEDEEG
jgi:hypothetical protein